MPSETPHDQWEGFHPRCHVCMYGTAELSLCRGEQRHSAVTAAGDLEASAGEVVVDIGSRRAPNTPHDLNHA